MRSDLSMTNLQLGSWTFILWINLLVGMAPLPAQVPHFVSHDFEVQYDVSLNCIAQDKRGFIWLGTDEGLFRYDGTSYKQISAPDTDSQSVTAITCGESETIWIGLASGKILLVDNSDKLVSWLPEEGLPSHPITGILEDLNGRLWISTYGEGVYVNDDGRLFNFDVQDGIIENQIYAMALDSLGKIWLATDNGISICRFMDRKKEVHNLNLADGLLDEIVYTLYADRMACGLAFTVMAIVITILRLIVLTIAHLPGHMA